MVVPASQPHKGASGEPQRWQSVVSQTSIYPSSRPPEQGELERLEVEIKMLRMQIHESSEAAMTAPRSPFTRCLLTMTPVAAQLLLTKPKNERAALRRKVFLLHVSDVWV